MKSLILIPIILLAIIPSLAFATTHQETFPTFYRNMTILQGDSINVTNPTNFNFQIDGDGFGSGSIGIGDAVLFHFNKLGNFAVFDDIHHNLKGFINVVDPAYTPIIFTNQTTYKQGDLVDIYGKNLSPSIKQILSVYDSKGNLDQAVGSPITQSGDLFLPYQIPTNAEPGIWTIQIIQNGQSISNNFIIKQSIQNQAIDQVSNPQNNNTSITNSITTQNNSTKDNSTVTVLSSSPSVSDESQQIKDLTAKVDALTTKLDAMSTEQDGIFGMLNKLLSHFNIG